ncbi:MAG: Histidine triad (HIT) protein [Microgenomates bacterium 39_6]|nr:MAG: Histidine triad (HIT) protein [Microgenomates bacterium 39_6]
MVNCIFCQISEGKIPAHVVYQDEQVVAFLDNQPKSCGHILIIPRKHFTNIFDIPDDLLAVVIKTTKKIARNIKKSLKPEGLNICQNNGALAGQTIDHLHFHLIPRYQKKSPTKKENFTAILNQLNKK